MARFLAIDADAGGLIVVSASPRGGGSLAIEQTVALAHEAAPLSASNAVALGAKLKDLLKQAHIRPAPALVVLGRDRVILKDVTYPPSAPADEPAVVRFQAIRDLGLDFVRVVPGSRDMDTDVRIQSVQALAKSVRPAVASA